MTAQNAIAVGSMLDGTTILRAQLADVSNEQWTRFVHALTIDDDPSSKTHGSPRHFGARSSAGGFGCFDLRPRRLADLGIMRGIRTDNSSGRCVTVGDFIAPMTQAKFLAAPLVQYNALLETLRRYDRVLVGMERPAEMSRSGALALFHRLGPLAMTKWSNHQERSTIALFQRANGIF